MPAAIGNSQERGAVANNSGRGRQERRSALDMPTDEFRSLGHSLIEQIADFYDSLPQRNLAGANVPAQVRQLLGADELPEQGMDAEDLLASVAPLLLDNSLHNGHPKFLGYITSSAAPLGALADLLAAALNANLAKWDLSPMASEIETQTVRWLADLIGYERNCDGLMVSGGNMANFLAFVAARCSVTGGDIRSAGNYGEDKRLTVYASRETHTWIEKAADVCGIGTDAIRWIDTDRDGRIRLDRLSAQLDEDRRTQHLPFLVVGTAGSVSTGVIDPLREMAALCREHGVWFHVDGAYGAPAATLPESPDDLHALELADSVAIDPHKWLYCPIEVACVLTKHKDALKNAFSFRPDYYKFDDEQASGIDYYEHGMQNTRGFRALKVWMALRRAGREGYAQSIRDDIHLAQSLFNCVASHPEFEERSIHLSIATFRYVPRNLNLDHPATRAYLNDLNTSLLAELQKGGRVFLSNAIVDGDYLLRACVVNFRTTIADIEEIRAIIADTGSHLDHTMRPKHLAA